MDGEVEKVDALLAATERLHRCKRSQFSSVDHLDLNLDGWATVNKSVFSRTLSTIYSFVMFWIIGAQFFGQDGPKVPYVEDLGPAFFFRWLP